MSGSTGGLDAAISEVGGVAAEVVADVICPLTACTWSPLTKMIEIDIFSL
jgi:hypothetical protein